MQYKITNLFLLGGLFLRWCKTNMLIMLEIPLYTLSHNILTDETVSLYYV